MDKKNNDEGNTVNDEVNNADQQEPVNSQPKITAEMMDKIRKAAEQGRSLSQIAEEIGVSKTTIHKRLKMLRDAGNQKNTDNHAMQEETEDNREHHEREGNKKRQPMDDDQKVQRDLFKSFEDGAYKELLPIIKEEFKARFKAGATLVHYELVYRKMVEEMGVDWERFLSFSIETGFSILSESYVEDQLTKEREENVENALREKIKLQTVERAMEV